MDDLISRSAVIEELKDWRGDKEDLDRDDPHDVGYYAAMGRAIRIAERAPTIDAVPRWNSVKERLPEPFVSVLVHMPGEVPHPTVREGYVSSEGVWVAGYFRREPDEVTHWMPTPEPPKGHES